MCHCTQRLLHQENKLPICVTRKRYSSYSTTNLYRQIKFKKDISNKETDKRKTNKGRRKSLTVRDGRRFIHKLYELRGREGSLTAQQLQQETGLTNCSN